MAETGSEGYEQDKQPERQETVANEGRAPRGIRRLLRHVRHPRPEADDPRDQPLVTGLLSHISESGGEDFDQFEKIADCMLWSQKNRPLDQDQEYALKQRVAAEIADDQIHTLATEQMPQLLNAVLRYQLPLKDYHTVLILAETAAEKADKGGMRLVKEAESADFEERVASAYALLTDEKIFDAQRLKIASEMLREVITANGIARIVVRKGKLALDIEDTLQYNLFGPETRKLYADFIDRLKVSLKYDPNRTPHDELYEIPGMDEEQLLYEAQRMAYQARENDHPAQPLEENEQVMLPLESQPWEVTALHEDQTATVKGIATPDTAEPVEKKVPAQWLVRAAVVETYKKSLALAFPTLTLGLKDNPTLAERSLEGRKKLWNVLAETIPATGFMPPADGNLTILDWGCARCPYGLVLTSYFGRNDFEVNNTQIQYRGIDEITDYIEDDSGAKERYKHYENFDFFISNLTNRSEYPPEAPQQADVVFIGNPGPIQNAAYFQEALTRVTPTGIVVATFMRDQDYTISKEMLSAIPGYEIVTDKKTDERSDSEESNSYIMVLKPKQSQP